jgi:hypothetical protein
LRFGILLYITLLPKRTEQSVHGALVESEHGGYSGNVELLMFMQEFQDVQRPYYGLDQAVIRSHKIQLPGLCFVF